jgi:DNA protecting protein DprA
MTENEPETGAEVAGARRPRFHVAEVPAEVAGGELAGARRLQLGVDGSAAGATGAELAGVRRPRFHVAEVPAEVAGGELAGARRLQLGVDGLAAGASGDELADIRRARLYLMRTAEPPAPATATLVELVGPIRAAELVRAGEVPEPVAAETSARRAVDLVEADLVAAAEAGSRLLVPEDPSWPAWPLAVLGGGRAGHARWAGAPLGLWVRGVNAVAALAEQAVAVVGSRSASGYGEQVAAEFGHGLALAGYTVVSGAAYGIDGAAHRGALAAGGPTVAVLACGPGVPYPAGHTNLLRSISEHGAVLSEYPPGTPPARHRFLVRNRLIVTSLGVAAEVRLCTEGFRSSATVCEDHSHCNSCGARRRCGIDRAWRWVVTASAWIAIAALVVSVSQAVILVVRYYLKQAKANLSAQALRRHATTPWSITTSRDGPIQKGTSTEILVMNHGPHQATDITVQMLDENMEIIDRGPPLKCFPFQATVLGEATRTQLRVLHPQQEVVLELLGVDGLTFPPAVRLTWRDGRKGSQSADWLIPPRTISEP